LQDEDIVVIKVQVKAFLDVPSGVGVDLYAFAEKIFQPFGQIANGRAQLVNGVEDERCSFAYLFNEF
jgi:hypothetical protein